MLARKAKTGDQREIVIIDWQSTPSHARFNDAFIAVTETSECKFASFCSKLSKAREPNSILWVEKGRFSRLARVLAYCFKNRKSKFLFITYDSLFIPLITMLCGDVIVYEHNTTPERRSSIKHVLWQRIAFRRVVRLAQYTQQFERLKELNQRCYYLGSPIKEEKNHACENRGNKVLIGCRNFSYTEAKILSEKLDSPRILIRKMTRLDEQLATRMNGFKIEVYDWLPDSQIRNNVKAIYVNLDTIVRGSGWFNDAISFNIPLILNSPTVIELFTRNFEHHSYHDLRAGQSSDASLEKLSLTEDRYLESIRSHNDAIRNRFSLILDECFCQ